MSRKFKLVAGIREEGDRASGAEVDKAEEAEAVVEGGLNNSHLPLLNIRVTTISGQRLGIRVVHRITIKTRISYRLNNNGTIIMVMKEMVLPREEGTRSAKVVALPMEAATMAPAIDARVPLTISMAKAISQGVVQDLFPVHYVANQDIFNLNAGLETTKQVQEAEMDQEQSLDPILETRTMDKLSLQMLPRLQSYKNLRGHIPLLQTIMMHIMRDSNRKMDSHGAVELLMQVQ